MKKLTIILFAFLFTLTSCTNSTYIWFYYPDKSDLSEYTQSPELKTIEECRNWVNWQWFIDWIWDYECWYKCRYDTDYSMYICKTTER